jgi:hypothetical protein
MFDLTVRNDCSHEILARNVVLTDDFDLIRFISMQKGCKNIIYINLSI